MTPENDDNTEEASSLQTLVGALGEFTDGRGRTKQCRVTGTEYGGKGLIIAYYNDEAGRVIEGAHIAACAFRPDERPNADISRPASK